jgi:hypothetical protein
MRATTGEARPGTGVSGGLPVHDGHEPVRVAVDDQGGVSRAAKAGRRLRSERDGSGEPVRGGVPVVLRQTSN